MSCRAGGRDWGLGQPGLGTLGSSGSQAHASRNIFLGGEEAQLWAPRLLSVLSTNSQTVQPAARLGAGCPPRQSRGARPSAGALCGNRGRCPSMTGASQQTPW